ncbi:MAG TPA: class I SAM-dependent methyltransferase [Bryobacteraceae bacterium]|nr:class I SAM-dependent methyltransferase [Bryobacteraceae bacterium]
MLQLNPVIVGKSQRQAGQTVPSDVAELVVRAREFAAKLQAARQRIAPREFDWYPYDSLTNLTTLERLLSGENRDLLQLAAGDTILDVGCADGDLGFFFESLGCRVQAIDNPITNFNAMRAVRALKAELGSNLEIHEADLDAQFELPRAQYGLIFFLGTLYHLKNPYYALEKLSRHARCCVVSTNITQYVTGLYETVTATSIAYLADVYELNRDSTNYWVFSDAGFRRLLKRTNWDICDYLLTGERAAAGDIAGQRAFCLARSRFRDQVNVLLGRGWHDAEEGGWRWTQRRFAVRLESSTWTAANQIVLEIYIPEALIARTRSLTLAANMNGRDLEPETYTEAGLHQFRRSLAPLSTAQTDIRIDFALSDALPPDAADDRERGIIVSAITAG